MTGRVCTVAESMADPQEALVLLTWMFGDFQNFVTQDSDPQMCLDGRVQLVVDAVPYRILITYTIRSDDGFARVLCTRRSGWSRIIHQIDQTRAQEHFSASWSARWPPRESMAERQGYWTILLSQALV
jgi:hypothetical protein